MLAEITPEEMDEVVAFERLEPDPVDRLAEILKRGFTAMSWSGEIEPSDFEPVARYARQAESEMSPNQQVQLVKGIVPGLD